MKILIIFYAFKAFSSENHIAFDTHGDGITTMTVINNEDYLKLRNKVLDFICKDLNLQKNNIILTALNILKEVEENE